MPQTPQLPAPEPPPGIDPAYGLALIKGYQEAKDKAQPDLYRWGVANAITPPTTPLVELAVPMHDPTSGTLLAYAPQVTPQFSAESLREARQRARKTSQLRYSMEPSHAPAPYQGMGFLKPEWWKDNLAQRVTQFGINQQEIGRIRRLEGLNQASPEEIKLADTLSQQNSVTQSIMDTYGFFEGVPLAALSQAPYMAGAIAEGMKYGTLVGTGLAAMGAAAGVSGPQAIGAPITVPVGSAAGLGIGYSVGAVYGSVNYLQKMESGLLYDELRNIPGVDQSKAFLASELGGWVNAATEVLSMRFVLHGTGLDRLLGNRGVQKPFTYLIGTKFGKNLLTRLIGGTAGRALTEGVQEGTQEVPGVVASNVLRGTPQDILTLESAQRIWQAGRLGTQAGILMGGAAQTASQVRDWSSSFEGVKGAPVPVIGSNIPDTSEPSGRGAHSYFSASQGETYLDLYDEQWNAAERAALTKIDDYTRATGDTLPQVALAQLGAEPTKEAISQLALQLADPLTFDESIPHTDQIISAPVADDSAFIANPRLAEATQVVQAHHILAGEDAIVGFINIVPDPLKPDVVKMSLPVLQVEGRLFTTHPVDGTVRDITRSTKSLGIKGDGTAIFVPNTSSGIEYEVTDYSNLRLVPGQLQIDAPELVENSSVEAEYDEAQAQEALPAAVPEVSPEDLVQTGSPPEGTIPQVLRQPGAVALARSPKPGHSPRGARYSAQSGPAKRAAAAFAYGKPKIPPALFDTLLEHEKVGHLIERMKDAARNFAWEELSHLDPDDLHKLSYAKGWQPTPQSLATLKSEFEATWRAENFKSSGQLKKTPSAVSPDTVDAFVRRFLTDPSYLDVSSISDPKAKANEVIRKITEIAEHPGNMAFDTLMMTIDSGFTRETRKAIQAGIPADDLFNAHKAITLAVAEQIHGDKTFTENQYDVLGNVERTSTFDNAQRQLTANALNLHIQSLGIGRIASQLLRADESIGYRRESASAIAISKNQKRLRGHPLYVLQRAHRKNEQEVSMTLRELAPYLKAFALNPRFGVAVSAAMSSDRELELTKRNDQKFSVKIGLGPKGTKEFSVYETVKFLRDDFFPRFIKGDGTGRLEKAYIQRLAFQSNAIHVEMDRLIERWADQVLGAAVRPITPGLAQILEDVSQRYGDPKALAAWLADPATAQIVSDSLEGQSRKVKSTIHRGLRNLKVLSKAVADRTKKIEDVRKGSLQRVNYFTALHMLTNEAFLDQLRSPHTPTSLFGISDNVRDDYLKRRKDTKNRPYMDPGIELMYYIPLALKMIHIEPAFHQFFTQTTVEGYSAPFEEPTLGHQRSKHPSVIKHGTLTGSEISLAIWHVIEDMWKNLQGQINPVEGNLNRSTMQVAAIVGRKTLASVLGDKIGLKTTHLAQSQPLSVPEARVTMSWGRAFQMYSYATLLDPIGLAVVNGLDVAWNAMRLSAEKPGFLGKEYAKGLFWYIPRGFLNAIKILLQESKNRTIYGLTGRYNLKNTPEAFRYGALSMMAEMDEMMIKHKRGLQTVKEGFVSRSMNLMARINMSGGRLGDTLARVTTFESTRLHLIGLGVDPDEAGWNAAEEAAYYHGVAGPLGDAPSLYGSTFKRLTLKHLTSYIRMRLGQEIMWSKTSGVRTTSEGKGYQNFIENPQNAGEFGTVGTVTLPNGQIIPAPRTPDEIEAQKYQGMVPLLGGPLVRPSDDAIWAARRQLILGNAATILALYGLTTSLGWSLWKALFIPSKIGFAAIAGLAQAVEHFALIMKKPVTTQVPGQEQHWSKYDEYRLHQLGEALPGLIPIYGPGMRGWNAIMNSEMRRRGITPEKTPAVRSKPRPLTNPARGASPSGKTWKPRPLRPQFAPGG